MEGLFASLQLRPSDASLNQAFLLRKAAAAAAAAAALVTSPPTSFDDTVDAVVAGAKSCWASYFGPAATTTS